MIAILVNCITLGSYQPCYDTHCESNRCQWLKLFDHVIFVFFFMEMLIKMIAMGVSNAPQAYLADYWNRLDCFIVLAGGLEYVLDVGQVNFTAIRTVRVLRPLRAINRIPSEFPPPRLSSRPHLLGASPTNARPYAPPHKIKSRSAIRARRRHANSGDVVARYPADAGQRPPALLLRLLHIR